MEVCIIKWGRSFHNIISAVATLISVTKTMENSTDSVLQAIIYLLSETLKGAFFRLGENITDLPDQKNQIVAVDIARR